MSVFETRARQSTARANTNRRTTTSAQTQSQASGIDLPPYRKPTHPLNARAQAKLRAVYGSATANPLRDHRDKATKLVSETAGSINDVLREREQYVDRRRLKWAKGEHTEEQEMLEKELEDLKQEVDALTARLEESMRHIIDHGEGAKRIKEALDWVRDNGPRQIEWSNKNHSASHVPRRPRRSKKLSGKLVLLPPSDRDQP